jgi:hypothetical protein
MASGIDLFQIIFTQILKIDPNIISNYTTLQDQFLYLILIPQVVLILFVYAFSRGFVNRFITGGHIAFSYLVGIVVYIYIIWSGFYGGFLVSFLVTWLYIALGLALFLFFISIFWHPAAGKVGGALIGKLFSTVAEKTVGKSKKEEAIQAKIENIDARINALNNQLGRPGITRMQQSYLQMQIADLDQQKAELQRELSRL